MTRLLYVYLCLGLWMLFRRVLCVCGDHLSAGGSSGRREAEYASRRASRQRCFFGSTEAARVERGRNQNLGARRPRSRTRWPAGTPCSAGLCIRKSNRLSRPGPASRQLVRLTFKPRRTHHMQ
jgi:hypothetical protein